MNSNEKEGKEIKYGLEADRLYYCFKGFSDRNPTKQLFFMPEKPEDFIRNGELKTNIAYYRSQKFVITEVLVREGRQLWAFQNDMKYVNHISDDAYLSQSLFYRVSNNETICCHDLYDYFSSRNVEHFIHFTPYENLTSILKSGLIPRSLHDGMNVVYPDKERRDGMLDCTSLSVSFPNEYMLSSKMSNAMSSIYAILRLRIDLLLYIRPIDIAFYPYNAASQSLRGADAYLERRGLNAAREMFKDYHKEPYFLTYREHEHICENCPTSVQAEVFVKDVIPASFIDQIVVKDDIACEKVKQQLERNNFMPYVDRLTVDEKLFGKRSEYYWGKIYGY